MYWRKSIVERTKFCNLLNDVIQLLSYDKDYITRLKNNLVESRAVVLEIKDDDICEALYAIARKENKTVDDVILCILKKYFSR
jgi:hypothetical protein